MTPILLDTVVISELRKGSKTDVHVQAWNRSLASAPVVLSVITLLELRKGIEQVQKRDPAFAIKLEHWYHTDLATLFHNAILPVDRAVAECAGGLYSIRTFPPNDALIAATALVHGLTLATRNEADFAGTGVTVVNPWQWQP